jgi:hypothetical protein
VALVLGAVPAGTGPAQAGEGGVQARLVPLHGENVVSVEVLADQRGEGALGVEGILCRHLRYADLRRDMPTVCLAAGNEIGIIIPFKHERDENDQS